VIALGNHFLVPVKDNQRKLRVLAVRAAACAGARGVSKTQARNRWEVRDIQVSPAQDLLSSTPSRGLIKTALRLERTVRKRVPGSCRLKVPKEIVFYVSSACGLTASQWNDVIQKHWRIENGSHPVRDTPFAEDASQIRRNPDIAARLRSFAYNLIRAQGRENIRNARYRAALDVNPVLAMPGIA